MSSEQGAQRTILYISIASICSHYLYLRCRVLPQISRQRKKNARTSAEAEPDARNIDFKFNYKQKRVAANFKRNVHPPTPVFTTVGDAVSPPERAFESRFKVGGDVLSFSGTRLMELWWRIWITQKYNGCHWSCRKRCAPAHFGTIGSHRKSFPAHTGPPLIQASTATHQLLPHVAATWSNAILAFCFPTNSHNDDLLIAHTTRPGSLADGLKFYLNGPAAILIEPTMHFALSLVWHHRAEF